MKELWQCLSYWIVSFYVFSFELRKNKRDKENHFRIQIQHPQIRLNDLNEKQYSENDLNEKQYSEFHEGNLLWQLLSIFSRSAYSD